MKASNVEAMNILQIFGLWRELDPGWGRPTWARQCLDHPDVYDVGDGTCPFAYIDIRERRILDTDGEFIALASGERVRAIYQGGRPALRWRDLAGSVTVAEFGGEAPQIA